jgi:GPH family glycoside/pentoside/hexuronide:cation symporter
LFDQSDFLLPLANQSAVMSNTFPSGDSVPPDTSNSKKLSFGTKLAYGAGDFGPAIAANLEVFFGLYFFTNVAGLSAGLAGSILLIGKIWDAVNDPMLGVLSDRTKSRWGRRLPWILYGAIPFGIFLFLRWIVPSFSADRGINNWGLFGYYVLNAILFNSFYTAVNLPYTALTPELTQDYNERTNLNSFRFAFSIGGSILSLILAQVIFSNLKIPVTQQYLVLAGICTIISVLSLFWCVWGIRHRVFAYEAQRGETDEPEHLPIPEQLRIVLGNRPFLFVAGIYLFSWLGVQVTASILPYFVVNRMEIPESDFPLVAIAVQGTALVMLFIWRAISDRVGKTAVYFMGMILWIIAQAGLYFLEPGQIGLMYLLAVLAGFGVSTAYLIPWSMMPDVIELDELNTGQRREGIFYAFMVFLQKVALAVGLFLVGQALEFAGFIERIPGQPIPEQSPSAVFAIRIAIGPVPTLALICGLILAYFYPITREVHAEILLKLRERRLDVQSDDSHS